MKRLERKEIEEYVNRTWVPEIREEKLREYLPLEIIALNTNYLGVRANIKDVFYGWHSKEEQESSDPSFNILVDYGTEHWLNYMSYSKPEAIKNMMQGFGAIKQSQLNGIEVMAIVWNGNINHLAGICPIDTPPHRMVLMTTHLPHAIL